MTDKGGQNRTFRNRICVRNETGAGYTQIKPGPCSASQRVYIYMMHVVKLRMRWAMYGLDTIQERDVIRLFI